MSARPCDTRAVKSRAYAFIERFVHLLLRLFFRRVEVTGLEHVPAEGGGLVVSWHPNGMIDPALIFESMPRPVVFGARHGLFRVPVLGGLLRAVGTVAIYRAMDAGRGGAEARREANQRSLDALARTVAEGSFGCLFPEGDSHDAPHLIELKTGLARLYYRARQLTPPGAPAPVILPVGLHYDEKRLFRSNVLVSFHPPIALPPELDVTPGELDDEEAMRLRHRELMGVVETVLHDAVHATESWDVHHLMHRARKLVRAERAHRAGSVLSAPTMEERTKAFARIWAGYYQRLETKPGEVHALRERIRDYDADLRALGMDDHELDRPPPLVNAWLAVLLLLQVGFVYLFLPPLLVVGYLVNGPPVAILWLVTRAAARKKKDEASIKVLLGAVLFPLTWALVGVAASVTHAWLHGLYPAVPDTPFLAGSTMALLSFAGGAVAARYLRLSRETARALRVRLTRERRRLTVARLRVDREALFDALIAMAEGLALPGSVQPDGTIGPSLMPPEPRRGADRAGAW